MNSSQKTEREVAAVLEKISGGQITDDIYKVVCKNQIDFHKVGITPQKIAEILEIKPKVAFLPDAFSYSLARPGRGDYLIANCDSTSVIPVDNNEIRFLSALDSFYQYEADYKEKTEEVSRIAKESFKQYFTRQYYGLSEEQETELLVDIVLDRGIDRYPFSSCTDKRRFLSKFDFYDAYHMEDSMFTLKWKAGEILESKGLLGKGLTGQVFEEAGLSVDKLRENYSRYQVDKLRINDVEVFKREHDPITYIRCRVDDVMQPERKLSVNDAKRIKTLGGEYNMGVKYYADVLDKNREEGRAIADERTLVRKSMPYADRLADIYRNGMNEQDKMLLKASEENEFDPFWWDSQLLNVKNASVEEQKQWAFEGLIDYIKDIRPGMLTDEEIVRLALLEPYNGPQGRNIEKNLMEIPTVFFPVLEESGEFDNELLAYTKVLRGVGRVTPTIAYDSMCYYLSQRFHAEWDPVGADDEYGNVVGRYFYPHKNMKNPADMFAPNLLNEKQWKALGKKYNVSAPFIPNEAFRKNRITNVQIYPFRDGSMGIRCVIDNEQQAGKKLSVADASRYNPDQDLRRLALGYFTGAFAKENDRENAMRR